MAEPITWKNITGYNPADAIRPMYYGAQTINQGFDQLQKVLGGITANDEANWQNQKVNNTQAFLSKLAAYKTPEQLAAAQAAGELDTMKEGFGAQVDQAAIRGAEENRIGQLRTALTQEQKYVQDQNILAHQPITEQMKAAALRGDDATFNQMAANFPQNPELDKVLEFKRGLARQNTADQQNTTLFNQKVEMFPLEKQAKQGEIANQATTAQAHATQANAALARAQADILENQARAAKEESARIKAANEKAEQSKKDAYKQLREQYGMSSGTLDTEEGQKAFREGLKGMNISEQQASDIFYNLNESFGKGGIEVGKDKDGKPILMPIPVSDALKAVGGATDTGLWWSRKGDDFVNILQNRFGHKTARLGMDNTKEQDKARIDEIRAVLRASSDRLSPLHESFAGKSEAEKKSPELGTITPNAAAGLAYLNNPANRSAVMADMGRIASMRPDPKPWTPGQQLEATKMSAATNPEIKQRQIDGLRQDYAGTNDPVLQAQIVKDIEAAGGTLAKPDGSLPKLAPVATLAPGLARPGDDKITPTSSSVNLAISGNGPATKTSAQVELPKDLVMKPATTVVEGTNTGGNRTILTFAPNTKDKADGQVRKYSSKDAEVKDGDGIDFNNVDGSKLVCRLDTIDAPETAKMWKTDKPQPHQNHGERSKKTLKDMVENKEVTVRISQAEGRYGRSYCQIEVEGENVDKKLIQQGAAWLYREYGKTPNRPDLVAAEAEAKAAKRGLWDDPNPEEPYRFRQRYK